MDGRSETPQTQKLTRCENERIEHGWKIKNIKDTYLTFCENTRNAKRVSMDGKSETTDTETYIL